MKGKVLIINQGPSLMVNRLVALLKELEIGAVIVEVASRLVGVGADVVHPYLAEVRGTAGVDFFCL